MIPSSSNQNLLLQAPGQGVYLSPIVPNSSSVKKIALLLDKPVPLKRFISNSPDKTDLQSLAKENDAAILDCFHSYDPYHLSTFMSQLPLALHKRVGLYIIRQFINDRSVNDIIDNFLRPAISKLIEKGIYRQEPDWLNDLATNTILSTIASIQSELGGAEEMQAEYTLIKNYLQESSMQLAALGFIEQLKINPGITTVYAWLEEENLGFLDKHGKLEGPTNDEWEKHLTVTVDGRTISVHLFVYRGFTYSMSQHGLLRFAEAKGLKVPPSSPTESSNQFCRMKSVILNVLGAGGPAPLRKHPYDGFRKPDVRVVEYASLEIGGDIPLQEYLEHSEEKFNLWLKSQKSQNEDQEDLVDWLYCTLGRGNKLIQSYQDFKTLAVQALAESGGGPNGRIQLNRKKGHVQTGVEFYRALNLYDTRRKQLELKGSKPTYRTLLDIFPILNGSPKASELPDILQNYLSFLKLCDEALDKFIHGQMPDPVVGENACQIRAVMLAAILNKEGIQERLKQNQSLLKDHIQQIQFRQLILKQINNSETKTKKIEPFKEYLRGQNALIEISEELAVIISCYVLSETKIVEYTPNNFGVPTRHERILAKNFSKSKDILPNFADTIIKIAQKRLSEMSVSYVQRLGLQFLLSAKEPSGTMVFDNFVKTDERHRKITPCYPTMRLLLKGLYRDKIPILLRIEQFLKGQSKPYGILSMVFGNEGAEDYTLLKEPAQHLQKGAVIFHAKSITDIKQSAVDISVKISNYTVTKAILSAMAAHPQYGCDDRYRPEDPLCEKDRQLAQEWGTCKENPSLFIPEHIYYRSHAAIKQELINVLHD